jgi:hypothetical protein
MVLHTWNQQMLFHPHLHCIVPAAGLDEQGRYVVAKKADYLMPADALKKVLRHHFGAQIKDLGLNCDPAVWRKKWGINVQAFGSGENAIKYLGRYIYRSVIGDSRILSITDTHVTFRYKDRAAGNTTRKLTLSGIEFVKRYLRHVQPAKLRAVRYYGYHHPAAKKKRQRVQQGSGAVPVITAPNTSSEPETQNQEQRTKNAQPKCPCCQQPMGIIAHILPGWKRGALWQPMQSRAPPNQPQGASRA